MREKIKLYSLLIDQIQKYNTILWQFPTALVAANFFAINNLLKYPYLLLCLSILNLSLIFAFTRMVKTQRAIIDTTKKAEVEMIKQFPLFVPEFPQPNLQAPAVMRDILWILAIVLFFYSVLDLYGFSKFWEMLAEWL